jgi:hypothetical protein
MCSAAEMVILREVIVTKQQLPTDSDGKLSAYAWPGGYPIYYLDGDNCILCPACAEKYRNDEQENFRPVAAGVHYEGESLVCEQCNAEIESAYGNPDDEENN